MSSQRTENQIGLKTVGELLGMSFHVPDYQRGYRWTSRQVTDLLDDLDEFFKAGRGGFYCLQPLVVRRRYAREVLDEIRQAGSVAEVERLLEEKCEWEVIDGQQRLTTLYILMKCLEENAHPYSLKYETRQDSEKFLVDIETSDGKNNIDYHYMKQAWDTINEWFGAEMDKKAFYGRLKRDVKFIWYESVNEDPIKVFTRLNIGKIGLTNAELIKALFLNSSNFVDRSEESLTLRQQEIAKEWDEMEYALQNDEFWLFLHDKGYDRPTRIDFILELMCEKNAYDLPGLDNKKERAKKIGTDEYSVFRYFYEYFKGQQDLRAKENAWARVKTCFQTFKEWFDDLELYHYVGFLIACGKQVADLLDAWRAATDKHDFLRQLKDEIYGKVADKVDMPYKEDGTNKGESRPLLLFHNIQTVVNQNRAQQANEKYKLGVFYKFPFHLYKSEGWDVEHICSSTDNDMSEDKTRKEWLLNAYMVADEAYRGKIEACYKAGDEEAESLFNEIWGHFKEDESWEDKEKNQIGNYALLDSSTNRSYRNAIFPAKRRAIISKDRGVKMPLPTLVNGHLTVNDESRWEAADTSFVPPCTRQVFLKYYSPAIGDSNSWTRSDAEAYKRDIRACVEKLKENNEEEKP